MNDITDKHEKQISVLKLENERLKQKIKFLETKVISAQKRCACFRNNQKFGEESNENR